MFCWQELVGGAATETEEVSGFLTCVAWNVGRGHTNYDIPIYCM